MMTSSQIDTLICHAISYHQTLLDPQQRIMISQRITALIADRRDALAREAEVERQRRAVNVDHCSTCGAETETFYHSGTLLCLACLPAQTVGERGAW